MNIIYHSNVLQESWCNLTYSRGRRIFKSISGKLMRPYLKNKLKNETGELEAWL
jgi:hypothetical protein